MERKIVSVVVSLVDVAKRFCGRKNLEIEKESSRKVTEKMTHQGANVTRDVIWLDPID